MVFFTSQKPAVREQNSSKIAKSTKILTIIALQIWFRFSEGSIKYFICQDESLLEGDQDWLQQVVFLCLTDQ